VAELGGKIECPICDWDWQMESDDDRPHLCHQCGYDSELNDFDEEALNQWEKENKVPFQEQKEERYIVRIFSESTDDMELVWHRDREDRIVKSLGDTDWMIQMDNELPRPLTEMIYIPKNSYHRVIKGTGDLKVRINKLFTEEEKKYSTILIFGPQGVGKSTITKPLGEKLGMEVIGTDNFIDQGDWQSQKTKKKGWEKRKENEFKGMVSFLKNNLGKPAILDVGGSHGVWEKDHLIEIMKLISKYPNRFLLLPSKDMGKSKEFLRRNLLNREKGVVDAIKYWEALLKQDSTFTKNFTDEDKKDWDKRLERIKSGDESEAKFWINKMQKRLDLIKSGKVTWDEFDVNDDKTLMKKPSPTYFEDYTQYFIENMKKSGVGNHVIYNIGKNQEELVDEIIKELK
jgi:hypothetical protein